MPDNVELGRSGWMLVVWWHRGASTAVMVPSTAVGSHVVVTVVTTTPSDPAAAGMHILDMIRGGILKLHNS